jgi:hypothetical protein
VSYINESLEQDKSNESYRRMELSVYEGAELEEGGTLDK